MAQQMWSSLATALARLRADISFAVVDSVLIVLSYLTALGLRFLDSGSLAAWWPSVLRALPVIVAIHLVANVLTGSYGHVWEHASVAEAMRVAVATASSGAVLILGSLLLGIRPVPLMVLAAGALISLVCLGVVRFRSRLFSFRRLMEDTRERALVVGTGRVAAEVARHTSTSPDGATIAGFVETGNGRRGARRLAGLPLLGGVEDVPRLVEQLGVRQVIIASERGGDIARRLVDLCVDVDVRFRIVPVLDEVLTGRGGLDIRDLEVGDLLTRTPVSTDLDAVAAAVAGRRVLVTGAGGSIGAEIVSQLLDFEPASIIALDNDETHLHEGLVGWVSSSGTELVPALVDIRDRAALENLVMTHRPQVVFHAAAHKHVPLLESWPAEAVKTNVTGTRNLLDTTADNGLERFVLISTDKAVDPGGVMGASKRLAEMLVRSRALDGGGAKYASVRFGNVLGSRGSVVPTFAAQIRRGGPVTITDERMTRYFMTVGEAVELVLQASTLAGDGEVFVLDMGEPVRILDLAKRMIRLAGLVPGEEIAIEVTGIRPGEKLDETLAQGPLAETSHPQIRRALPGSLPDPDALTQMVDRLESVAGTGMPGEVRRLLMEVAADTEQAGATARRP
ncbi:MAG TPA: nucleoside-diphosphate sugar epimerase/dehydratase [Acidimicrobiia bacterium]|nr:nucleoside-diphosphate sugar epimerase/dehydratase [Acidimicrobiia bacterium]